MNVYDIINSGGLWIRSIVEYNQHSADFWVRHYMPTCRAVFSHRLKEFRYCERGT